MIVLDASAAVELVLRTAAGERVARQIGSSQGGVHAPHLLDAEFGSVIRRLERSGQVDPDLAVAALAGFRRLPIRRYEMTSLLARAWELRKNLTMYDAIYVVLAEALGAILLTTDKRLAKSPGSKVRIVPV